MDTENIIVLTLSPHASAAPLQECDLLVAQTCQSLHLGIIPVEAWLERYVTLAAVVEVG
jgi:hypothetical protein